MTRTPVKCTCPECVILGQRETLAFLVKDETAARVIIKGSKKSIVVLTPDDGGTQVVIRDQRHGISHCVMFLLDSVVPLPPD